MTNKEFKELTNWEKIRALSGIINPEDINGMIGRMGLMCLISRVEMGDASQDFLNKMIDKAFGEDNDNRTNEQEKSSANSESDGGESRAI